MRSRPAAAPAVHVPDAGVDAVGPATKRRRERRRDPEGAPTFDADGVVVP
jgi:hypothetical protein